MGLSHPVCYFGPLLLLMVGSVTNEGKQGGLETLTFTAQVRLQDQQEEKLSAPGRHRRSSWIRGVQQTEHLHGAANLRGGGTSGRDTVSVLGREEGYTGKYGLGPREILRAQAIFHRIS